MPNVLITGANRGIGFELTRQYVADGWHVFATCRSLIASEALENMEKEHDELRVFELDVTDHGAVDALAETLADTPLDLLINNAGTIGGKSFQEGAGDQQFGSMDYQVWARAFAVNTMAPLKFAEAFAGHLGAGAGKKLVTISSHMGSMTLMDGGLYIYRSSKAAVNAVMKALSMELKDRGITVALLHPGWVRTDMGTEAAEISVEESASGLRSVIAGLGLEDSGRFLSYEGKEIPW